MISVVIPVYRGRDRIGTALESVRGQTLADWEIVVAEDGPGDGSEAVVREFAATVGRPVRYLGLAAKLGTAAARNAALDQCRGDLIAFLDADDEWLPSHLASVVGCLGGGQTLAVSAIEIWDEVTGRPTAVHGMDPAWLAAPRDALFVDSIIHTASCVVVPRATVERVGRFDTAMPVGQDRDYWFRAVAAGGSLGYSGACTVRYVQHAASSTRDRRLVLASVIRFHDKHRHAAGVSDQARRRARARVLAAHGALAASAGSGRP